MRFVLDWEDTGELGLDKLDAKAIAEAGARALSDHTSRTIKAGLDPSTGAPKPDLKPRAAAKKGRKGGRGYDTGKLADGLRVRAEGSSISGKARVSVPSGRHAFIASEAKRGVVYLSVEGQAAVVIDDAVSGVLEDEIG